jgi:hypothetical protein
MAQKNPVLDLSFLAGADLSTDTSSTASQRYRAVKLDGVVERSVVVVAAASDVIIGVQQNLPDTGELVDVAVLGTTKVRAGAATTANGYLKLDAAGKFIDGGGGADVNWAIGLEAAAADGDVIEALLLHPSITT